MALNAAVSSQHFRNPLFEGASANGDESNAWRYHHHDSVSEDHGPISGADYAVGQNRRIVHVHVTASARAQAAYSNEFCSNAMVTAKYTMLNFVPVNLFEQFCRLANFYFLLNAILQAIPGLSPTNWATTILPLSFVLLTNAVKEAHDDYKRHRADREMNRRTCEVLVGESFVEREWSSIIVGDVVRIQSDSQFPADLVFLSSSDRQGLAYLETANLDGETNLKMRTAFYKSTTLNPEDGYRSFNALSGLLIECEQPNNRLYQFEGIISSQGQGVMSLDVGQILLRGATLRNTQWIIGAVVYTGAETKYMRNMVPAPRKVSQLERKTNILVAALFIFQLVLCMGLAIGSFVWDDANVGHYYLTDRNGSWPELGQTLGGLIIQFLRFMILLSSFIPISLYVTLELVKALQSMFLSWDLQMYYEPSGIPAMARTSNLNEELGQVEYVLSDKTGTLTENVMAFVQCSIGGVVYGSAIPNGSENLEEICVHRVCDDIYLRELLFRLDAPANSQSKKCQDFFFILAACHTVVPTYVENGDMEEISYKSSSPDEEALVQGAALCGFQLLRRVPDEIVIYCQEQRVETLAVLAVLEFTCDRKRMSVICRDSQGRLKLYCKGADTVVLKRLAKNQEGIAGVSIKHLEEFSRAGYRTLCIAEREIDDIEFEKWKGRFHSASASLDDREEKLAEAADSIEREMILLGVTAVEDKLQDGVPETITVLAQAGIKLWVLTGDKLETAVSIGLSCNLLADSMHLFLLYDSCHAAVPQMMHNMLDEARLRARSHRSLGIEVSDMAVVIEGNSLGVALEENNRTNFLELCQQCRAVVCCRVTPLQKAQVTRLVKEALAVTLAIGDGANDVGMIRAAHIGVGVSGREGIAAVIASDYSIAQFQYLARLLLIHGRWSHKRNKDLVMYSFYKNFVYAMGNGYLAFFSGMSAQSLYTSSLISTFNLCWTALPIIIYALLDKDAHQLSIGWNPQLYMETQKEKIEQFFKSVRYWILLGFYHSIVAFFIPVLLIISDGDGLFNGIHTLGIYVYTLVVLIVNIKVMAHMNSISWISCIVVWPISVGLYFVCILFLSYFWEIFHIFPGLCELSLVLYTHETFWLGIAVGLALAFVPDWAILAFYRKVSPADFEIIQEMEHGWKSDVLGSPPGYVEHISPPRSSSSPRSSVLEVLPFHSNNKQATNPQEVAVVEEEVTTLPRQMTWREVLSEPDTEGLYYADVGGWGRRRSSGFEVVTSHGSMSGSQPKPLTEGPMYHPSTTARASTVRFSVTSRGSSSSTSSTGSTSIFPRSLTSARISLASSSTRSSGTTITVSPGRTARESIVLPGAAIS